MGMRGRKATRAVEQLRYDGDALLTELLRLSAAAQRLQMPVTAAVLRQVVETGVAELRDTVERQRRTLAERGRLVTT